MTSKPVKVNRDLRSHRRTVLAGRRQRKGLRVRLGPKKASRKRFRSRSRLGGNVVPRRAVRSADLREARFWIVGSEEARLRAGLRPPPKLHVQISRMQLSR